MGTLNLGNGAQFTGGSGGFLADAPSGTIIKSGSYYTGTGGGAGTSSNSTTFYTININGTGQKIRNMTKGSDDVLVFNKISNDSHLEIGVEFPTYLDNGGNGMGFRVRLSVDNGSNYLYIPDNVTNNTNSSYNSQYSIWSTWGLNGYGGSTAGHLSCRFTTDSYTANADTIRTHTGNVQIYFEGRSHASADTAYWINYSTYWDKAGYVYVSEIKN
mgnify:FL=1|tara:strand:- start:942 stop:1586 length:645 start_codon:yes stop_codon:yes gene_type:complete